MLKLNRRIAAIKPSATLAADARATEMKARRNRRDLAGRRRT